MPLPAPRNFPAPAHLRPCQPYSHSIKSDQTGRTSRSLSGSGTNIGCGAVIGGSESESSLGAGAAPFDYRLPLSLGRDNSLSPSKVANGPRRHRTQHTLCLNKITVVQLLHLQSCQPSTTSHFVRPSAVLQPYFIDFAESLKTAKPGSWAAATMLEVLPH